MTSHAKTKQMLQKWSLTQYSQYGCGGSMQTVKYILESYHQYKYQESFSELFVITPAPRQG